MKNTKVYTINAMTYQGKNGNPAGVVLDSSSVSSSERQRLAREAGHSETAFLEKLPSGNYRLEFYTPIRKIEYCGHATVATFGLLRDTSVENRSVVHVEIGAEISRVFIQENGLILLEQKLPIYESLSGEDTRALIKAVNLSVHDLTPKIKPLIASTGNRFALIGLRSTSKLADLEVEVRSLVELSKKLNLIGIYAFVASEGEHAATTRMFAPLYGITEEAATGMAAGPLASALVDFLDYAPGEIRILQGEFMKPPKPSEIVVQIQKDDSRITSVYVGGTTQAVEI